MQFCAALEPGRASCKGAILGLRVQVAQGLRCLRVQVGSIGAG